MAARPGASPPTQTVPAASKESRAANTSCRAKRQASILPRPKIVVVKNDAKDAAPIDVTLSLGVEQVRTSVVVTASGTPQTTDEVSKALTVVDGDTIGLRADRSVGEALLEVPGLRSQQLAVRDRPLISRFADLRNTDTALLVDGLRLRDAAGTQGDASGVLQDLVIVNTSQIEVLRGTGSSLYGTDATGGVVNIVTDQGGGRTRGSVLVDGGSLGSIRAMAHLAGGFDRDRVQYSAGITHWNVTSGPSMIAARRATPASRDRSPTGCRNRDTDGADLRGRFV